MPKVSLVRNIAHTPKEFEKWVLSPHKSVVCDAKGNYRLENRLTTLIRKIIRRIFNDLFGLEASRQSGWSVGLVHVFDRLEQERLVINKKYFSSYLSTAKTVKNILKKNKSSKVTPALLNLKMRTTSLKYRMAIGYSDKYVKKDQVDGKLFDELMKQAESWKKTKVVFKSQKLTEKQKNQRKILSKYPKFATLSERPCAFARKVF